MIENKIICGDCLEVMKDWPDNCVDLVLTDPPYNFVSTGGGFAKKRGYIKIIRDSFGTDFKPLKSLEATVRLMSTYHAYWWCSKNLIPDYINWAIDKNYKFNVLLWHKLNPIPYKDGTFLPDTEYCIYIKKSGAYFNLGLDFHKYHKYWITGLQSNNGHPTPKPLVIMENQILLSSKNNDLILDPFCGSGTTCVAAKMLDRRYIGIDISEKYCQIARQRLEAVDTGVPVKEQKKGQLALFKKG